MTKAFHNKRRRSVSFTQLTASESSLIRGRQVLALVSRQQLKESFRQVPAPMEHSISGRSWTSMDPYGSFLQNRNGALKYLHPFFLRVRTNPMRAVLRPHLINGDGTTALHHGTYTLKKQLRKDCLNQYSQAWSMLESVTLALRLDAIVAYPHSGSINSCMITRRSRPNKGESYPFAYTLSRK